MMLIFGLHNTGLEDPKKLDPNTEAKIYKHLTNHLRWKLNEVDDTLDAVADDKDHNNYDQNCGDINVSSLIFIHSTEAYSTGPENLN